MKDEKDDPVASAKAFLAGLDSNSSDRPWASPDIHAGDKPPAPPPSSSKPQPPQDRDRGYDPSDQAQRLVGRNKKFAEEIRKRFKTD